MTDKPTWKAIDCGLCDFSSGTRGMDRCAKCDGTGSRLLHLPTGDSYPNTERGWNKMRADHPDVKDEDE